MPLQVGFILMILASLVFVALAVWVADLIDAAVHRWFRRWLSER